MAVKLHACRFLSEHIVAQKQTRPTAYRAFFCHRSRSEHHPMVSQAKRHTKFSPLMLLTPRSINTALTSAIRMAKNPVSLSNNVAKVGVFCVRSLQH